MTIKKAQSMFERGLITAQELDNFFEEADVEIVVPTKVNVGVIAEQVYEELKDIFNDQFMVKNVWGSLPLDTKKFIIQRMNMEIEEMIMDEEG